MLLDGIDGQPHRRFPPSVSKRLARLVVHANRHVSVHKFRFGFQPGQPVEHWLQDSAVAEHQIFDVGMTTERNISARQYYRRAMVATHSVKRDANLIRHGSLLAVLAPSAWPSEIDARRRP